MGDEGLELLIATLSARFINVAPEVRGVLRAAQFFLEAPMRIVADEHAEATAIQGQRQAVGGADQGVTFL